MKNEEIDSSLHEAIMETYVSALRTVLDLEIEPETHEWEFCWNTILNAKLYLERKKSGKWNPKS